MAALSFDEEFQRRRIRRRWETGGGAADRGSGARGAVRMMGHAVRDLGGGIYHGVTGVVVEPYWRARVRAVGHHPPSSIRIPSPVQQGTAKVGLFNGFCQ